jgi:hypothetical protein
MVAGPPQLKVMLPPPRRIDEKAAVSAASLQLAGVPVPTTTAAAGAADVARTSPHDTTNRLRPVPLAME